jgi:hypothetical protein
LDTIALVVENGGYMPVAQNEPPRVIRSPRTTMIVESLSLTAIFWTFGLLATYWFDIGGPGEGIAKVAALIFGIVGLLGLARFLQAFFLVQNQVVQSQPSLDSHSRKQALPEPPVATLPAAKTKIVSDYPRRAGTNEMVPRESVTDQTTRTLDSSGRD